MSSFESHKKTIRTKIDAAIKGAYNKSIVDSRLRDAEKYKAKIEESFAEEAKDFLDNEYPAWVKEANDAVFEHKRKKDVEDADKKIDSRWKNYEKNHERFPDRAKKFLEEIQKILDVYREYGFEWKAQQWEGKISPAMKLLNQAENRKKMQRALDSTKTPFTMVNTNIRSGRYENAKAEIEKALKLFQEKVESNPEFTDVDDELMEEFREQFYSKYMQAQDEVNMAMVEDELKKEGNNMVMHLSHAKTYFDRSRERSQEYYESAIDNYNQFDANPDYAGHPKKVEFIDKFNKKRQEFDEWAAEKRITERIRKASQDCMTPIRNAGVYIKRDPERALEYAEEAKQRAEDLAMDETISYRKEVSDFFEKFQKQLDSFNKSYREEMIGDMMRQAKGGVTTHINIASAYKNDTEKQMLSLQSAQDKLIEIETNPELMEQPDMVSFVEEKKQKVDEMEADIQDHIAENESKMYISDVRTKLSHAKMHLKSFKYDRAMEDLEDARDLKSNLENFESIAQRDNVKDFLAKCEKEIPEIEAEIQDKILENEIREAKNSVTTALAGLSGSKQRHDWAKAMEVLDIAQDRVLNIAADFPEKTDEFVEEYNSKIEAEREEIQKSMTEEEVKKAIQTVDGTLRNAHTYLNSHRPQQAMSYLEQAVDAKSDLEFSASIGDHPDVQKYLAEFDEKEMQFREEFAEKELKGKVQQNINSAKQALHTAKTYFNSHRYETAQKHLEKAQDLRVDMVSDPELSGLKQVQEFLEEFQNDIDGVMGEFQSKMEEEDAKQRMSAVSGAFGNAKVYFPNHPSRCTEYLQNAKDLFEDLQFESSEHITSEWKEGMQKKLDDFEIEFNQQIRAKEIKKLKQNIEMHIRNCEAYKKKSLQAALEHLEKAQDALSNFIVGYPSEEEFIEKAGDDIQKKQSEIFKISQNDEIKKQKDKAKTLLTSAKAYANSHRESQALELLQRCEDQLIDLEGYASEKSFTQKMEKEAREIRRNIIENAFNEEVKQKINKSNILLSNAKIYMDRGQKDRAVDYLQQAEDAAGELAEDKYIELSTVDEFFNTFNEKVRDLKEKFNQIIFGQEIKKAKESVRSALSKSRVYFQSHRHNQALGYLKETKEAFDEFVNNEDYINEGAFVEEMQQEIETFEKEFTETVYRNQVNAAVKKLDHHMSQAKNFLKYGAFDRALDSFEQAQTEVESMNQYASHSLAQERIEKFNKEKEDFENEYAEKALKKEAKKFTSSLHTILQVGEVMLKQKMTGRVLEQLEKGKDLISSQKGMIKKLSEAKSTIDAFTDFQKRAAQELLEADAEKAVRKAKRDYDKVAVMSKRGLKKQAAEELKNLAEEHRDLLMQDSNIAQLDTVKEFRDRVESSAAALKMKMEDLLKPQAKSAKAASSGDSLFESLINFEQLKLETVQMSTDISSKIFNAVKDYNRDAGRSNQLIRKFIREVDQLNVASGDDIARHTSYSIFKNQVRDMNKAAEKIPEDFENDQYGRVVVEGAKKFSEWVDTMKNNVKKIEEIQQALRNVDFNIKMSETLLTHASEFLKGGTIPAGTNISTIGPDRRSSVFLKYDDYELSMKAYERAQEAKSDAEQFAEKYDNFPMEKYNEITEQLSKKALQYHVKHCMRGFQIVGNKNKHLYFNQLRRFPLARKYSLIEMENQKYNDYVNHMIDISKDKTYQFEDPFEGQEISDAFPENEEDYTPNFELITPADESVPESNRKHESQNPMYWNQLMSDNAGKIVFSKSIIEKNEKNPDVLENEFTFGADEIHGRAIWKNTLNNFAIAKDKKTGEYLYPPEKNTSVFGTGSNHFACELLYFVKIDGNEVQCNDTKYNAFFFTDERQRSADETGTATDFYNWNQSMKLFVLQNKIAFFNSYQKNSVTRFNREFAKLSPGKHNVEIEIKYLIRSTNDNRNSTQPKFPTCTTRISNPIATGSFTINIPKGASPINLLPKRDSSIPNAGAIEETTLKMLRESGDWGKRAPKTEHILRTWLTSDKYVTRRHWLSEKPVQWGVNFQALVYRNPEDGWDREEIVIFNLATYTEMENENMPPCYGIGVSGNSTLPPDTVPEDVLKGVKNRYSGHYTDTFKVLTDEDRDRFFNDPTDRYDKSL